MTPLFRRAVAENRGWFIALTVALAVNILAYLLVARPLEAKSSGAAARATAAADGLSVAERELAQADALVKGKARADQELDAFYKNVLPSGMTAARRMTYASLPALARKAGVQFETRTTSIERLERDGQLERMVIRMVLQGDYNSLRQFIYSLEVAPDFVILDEVTLVEGRGDDALRLTVELSTYYRLTPNAS